MSGQQQAVESYAAASTTSKPTVGVQTGAIFIETDTQVVFQWNGTAWIVIPSLVAFVSSAGLTASGNLNPGTGVASSFKPAVNSLMSVDGMLNVTSYTSGTVGVAVTYNVATSGTKAAQTDQIFVSPTSTKTTTLSTAGNAVGVWSLTRKTFYASGGKVIQLKLTGEGTWKTSAYVFLYRIG